MKEKTRYYVTLIVATFLLAVAFNLFFYPLDMVIGGSSGLAIIANHLFGINPSVVVFGIYFIAIIVGLLLLGKDKIKNSILGSLLYTFWIEVTSPLIVVAEKMNVTQKEYMVIVIMGGILTGIAFGVVYRLGATTGGSDIAAQILKKYFGISMGTGNLIVIATIVIMGGYILGWYKVMYSVLILYISGIVMDKVLLGSSFSKAFYIVTNKEQEVKDFILDDFNIHVTEIESTTGFTDQKSQVLMCVVPTKEYFKLKEGINMIDDKAFFVVVDAYEVGNIA